MLNEDGILFLNSNILMNQNKIKNIINYIKTQNKSLFIFCRYKILCFQILNRRIRVFYLAKIAKSLVESAPQKHTFIIGRSGFLK